MPLVWLAQSKSKFEVVLGQMEICWRWWQKRARALLKFKLSSSHKIRAALTRLEFSVKGFVYARMKQVVSNNVEATLTPLDVANKPVTSVLPAQSSSTVGAIGSCKQNGRM